MRAGAAVGLPGSAGRPGTGARLMAVVDATPVHRWLAATAALVLAACVFWGGTVGRVDDSGRAAAVACRADLAPATDAETIDGAVLHWDSIDGEGAGCQETSDQFVGAHEAFVRVVSMGVGVDGSVLAVLYITGIAAALAALVRRLPGTPWLRALTGTAVLLVVADGSMTSALTSLDPAPAALVGLLVFAAAALDRRSPLGLVAGAFLLVSSIAVPWPVVAVLAVVALAPRRLLPYAAGVAVAEIGRAHV